MKERKQWIYYLIIICFILKILNVSVPDLSTSYENITLHQNHSDASSTASDMQLVAAISFDSSLFLHPVPTLKRFFSFQPIVFFTVADSHYNILCYVCFMFNFTVYICILILFIVYYQKEIDGKKRVILCNHVTC